MKSSAIGILMELSSELPRIRIRDIAQPERMSNSVYDCTFAHLTLHMIALYTVQHRDIARQPDVGHHIMGGFIFVGIAQLHSGRIHGRIQASRQCLLHNAQLSFGVSFLGKRRRSVWS